MKKIITTNIAGSVGQPVKSGTLSHLQSAYQQGFQMLMQNLYGIANNDTTVYVLYGCVNSGSSSVAGTCNISAGAVYYNGELYFVPATTFVIATGLVAVIDVTQNATNFFVAGNADPVTMTDGSAPYVHSQFQVTVIDDNNTATGYIADFSDFDYSTSGGFNNTTLVVADITPVGGGISSIGTSSCRWRRVGKLVHFDISITAAVLTGTNTGLTLNVNFLAPQGISGACYPNIKMKLSSVYSAIFSSVTGAGAPNIEIAAASGNFAAGTYEFYINGFIFAG